MTRQATDPVCGMTVSTDSDQRFTWQSVDYYFCCQGCRDKFTASPAQYLSADHSASEALAGHDQHADVYTHWHCPMCPEVQASTSGPCPSCGMALEPDVAAVVPTLTDFTCPMHPEVVQTSPGDCPECGMALEPRTVEVEEDNAELNDMTRRFWASLVLTLPVFVLAMLTDMAPQYLPAALSLTQLQWLQFLLATPVVLGGGWPLLVRAGRSLLSLNLNMFTLIGLGVLVAWGYSVMALLLPQVFPPVMRQADGSVAVYFEAAAVITTLVLLGQVLELRARHRTGEAIRLLLGLTLYQQVST